MTHRFVQPENWTTRSGYLTLIVLLFLMVFVSRQYRLHRSDAVRFEESVTLEIPDETTVSDILPLIETRGIQFNKRELEWASTLLGWRRVQPGYYQFAEPLSYERFLSRLALGLQDHKRITIPSGSRPAEFSSHLGQELRADSASFHALFTDGSPLAQQMGWTGGELFSRMLPDNYDLYWTWSPEQVARRLLDEFEKRVEQEREMIAESSYTLNELVTLASIIEWEAGSHEEKPTIAGLYVNRLERGMRLQADPTILYALGEHRRLYFEDYRMDHPFNTYRNDGLPPGPITNPDIHSLRAAFDPEDHNFLYMVATPEGVHRFTRTFQEHQDASRDWRRWLEEQANMGER